MFVLCRMALFKYFKRKEGSSAAASNNLLDENSPLCRELPSSSIREANLGVLAVTGKHEGKCSSYSKISGEQKALIAKYAAENGIVAALAHFPKDYPDGLLKESTVRGWQKEYLNELAKKEEKQRKIVGEITTLYQETEVTYAGINSRHAGTSIFDSY